MNQLFVRGYNGHHGRVTDPGFINPTDVIELAKRRTRIALATAQEFKNDPVPAGQRRTDVKIAVCKGACGKRKVVAQTTGICTKCWLAQLERELAEMEKATHMEDNNAE